MKALVLLANGMAAGGYQVSFLVPDYAAESPFPLAAPVRVERVSTGPAWLPIMVRKIYYYGKLAGLATRGAQLSLASYYLTALCAIISKFLFVRKTQVVWYVQGHEAVSHGLIADANLLSRVIRYLLAQLSYRLPARIICNSRWVRVQIGRPDGVVVPPPALDPEVFHSGNRIGTDSAIIIGTVGRRGETKGYRYFLGAMELLPDRSDVRILVASPEDVLLPSGLRAERVHPRSESEMAEFYRRCDIFVFPSLSEGFGLPPLEAMACGCAVVTAECGGVADFARHEMNCLTVPPRDAVALSGAVGRLCKDAVLRNRLAREGVRTAQEFTRARIISQFLEVLSRGSIS